MASIFAVMFWGNSWKMDHKKNHLKMLRNESLGYLFLTLCLKPWLQIESSMFLVKNAMAVV